MQSLEQNEHRNFQFHLLISMVFVEGLCLVKEANVVILVQNFIVFLCSFLKFRIKLRVQGH